jgi:hypothetical protein
MTRSEDFHRRNSGWSDKPGAPNDQGSQARRVHERLAREQAAKAKAKRTRELDEALKSSARKKADAAASDGCAVVLLKAGAGLAGLAAAGMRAKGLL